MKNSNSKDNQKGTDQLFKHLGFSEDLISFLEAHKEEFGEYEEEPIHNEKVKTLKGDECVMSFVPAPSIASNI